MTLQFPSDPINGAVSGDYTYDAAKGAWRKNAALPISVTHSDVAPSNPREGDQWWKSDEGTLFTYYNDGNSSQWVESTNVVANVEPNPIPAGAMMAWGSDTIPSNWLLCDGSAVSRSTYASLFAAVGTQYGSGDGTTTFNLPNIKGRTIVGKDSSQTEFDVLGETGGTKTHTLLISEMPSHTHVQDSHTHTQDAHNHSQNAHNHTQNAHGHQFSYGGSNYNSWSAGTGFGSFINMLVGNSGVATQTTIASTTATNIATTATNQATTATNQATTATNQSTGGGGAHNNLQPYIVLNYIIKFSAGETPGDSQLATRVGAVEAANNATPLGPNYLLNADFFINQRNATSTTTDNGFVFDRWKMNTAGGTSTYSAQAFALGNAIAGYEPTNYARLVTTGQTTSGNFTMLRQIVEDVRTLAGQTATVSFWAKAASGTPKMSLELEQNFGNGGSPSAAVTTYGGQVTLSTSWARYSLTVTLPSIAGKTIGTTANTSNVLCSLFVSAGSDWNARTGSLGIQSNTFDIWGVQLEAGQYATPFRRNAPSIQAELAACQRYYEKSYSTATSPGTVTEDGVHRHSGSGNGSGRHYVPIRFKVEKRTNGYTVDTYNPTAAGAAWITQNSAQAGLARTPLVENKSTSGMVLNVEDGGYAWAVGNTRGHWAVSDEL